MLSRSLGTVARPSVQRPSLGRLTILPCASPHSLCRRSLLHRPLCSAASSLESGAPVSPEAAPEPHPAIPASQPPQPAADAAPIAAIPESPATPAAAVVSDTSSSSVAADAGVAEGVSLLGLWHELLRVLHAQGDFEDPDTPCEDLLNLTLDVKTAILSFARRRPDVIFSLDPPDLVTLASVPLRPRDRNVDRKLRNADLRLKETFGGLEGKPKGGSRGSSVAEGAAVTINDSRHATAQDLLRVTWDWATAREEQVAAAAEGLPSALRRVLVRLRSLALAEPEAGAAERARRLGTPTAAELEERAAQETMSPEQRRRAKQEAFMMSRRRAALREAVSHGVVVEEGDWQCGPCGWLNWADRRRCHRCAKPYGSRGSSAATAEDISMLYGDNAPRRGPRPGAAGAAASRAAADGDRMYSERAAAAEAAAAARAARGEGRLVAGGDLRRDRRGPRQLEDRDAEEADSLLERRRGGRERYEGRPGLRQRRDSGDEGEGGRGPRSREGAGERRPRSWSGAGDGEEEEEVRREARSSPAYSRNLQDFYSPAGPGRREGEGQERGRAQEDRPPRRSFARRDDDGEEAEGEDDDRKYFARRDRDGDGDGEEEEEGDRGFRRRRDGPGGGYGSRGGERERERPAGGRSARGGAVEGEDLSLDAWMGSAGEQAGGAEGRGERSGREWEGGEVEEEFGRREGRGGRGGRGGRFGGRGRGGRGGRGGDRPAAIGGGRGQRGGGGGRSFRGRDE
ncbi:hypothetical protein HYH03_013312 [Edaphochlamys debaryana]|uniref:RanBP2-type domain-containing protein n=1 Tax=Edaphochlamys debaryana TaxID=47281 RepID=A0A836BTB9_9CHLO|nr:hypothetical protein HYH03_013312 [Edaphochlamys debaryana]|eukprot:KAG2488170.1 hypothetical protein HYH03_013312 [Edaphochlamys debaryana]